MNCFGFFSPQIQPVCNWNQTAKLKENDLQSWSFNFGLSDLNTEFGRGRRGSQKRRAVRTDEGKICSSLSIWVKRGFILWNNWNVALSLNMGTTLIQINSSCWKAVCLMAVTDPESLIQVLSMGMERDKKFPRTIHPVLRHLSKACGMHLLQDGCLSPSLWMELRRWAHIGHLNFMG